MVRAVLQNLQLDKPPAINNSLLTSPASLRLLSPPPSHAFLRHLSHTPTAALRRSRPPHPLHLPLSPPTPSPRRDPMQIHAAASSPPTFYQILGLPDDVAIPDIKTAYRQMARKYHPDVVCPHASAEESRRRFLAVQEAYETLADPERRASYDRSMSSGSSGTRWSWRSDEEVQMHWRYRWEDQLFNMKRWSAIKATQSPDSWGARMRKQQHEHEYV